MGNSESRSDDGRRSRRRNESPNNNSPRTPAIPDEFLSEHISALLESQREAYDTRIRELERSVARTAVLNAQTISNVCTNNSMQTQATPSPARLYPQIPEPRHLSTGEARSRTTSPFHSVSGQRVGGNRNYGNAASYGSPSNMAMPPPSAPTLPSTSRQGKRNQDRSRTRNDRNANNGSVCPTCKNKYGLSRIYQCGNGHSSCTHCKNVQKACGVCRHPITDMRNITLEVALAEATEPCPNAREGCSLHFKLADMPAHQKECPFNDMFCPFYQINGLCNFKVKSSQLKSHFTDAHPRCCGAEVDKEISLLIDNVQHHVYLVELGNFLFLAHCKVDVLPCMFYIAIQLIGTKVSSDKWTYNIQIYNKREPRRKFDYTNICTSYSEDIKDIFNDYNCLSMPLDFVSTFVIDNVLNFKFYIKKDIENQRNRPNRGKGGGRGRGQRPT